jgi:hypothetical protein
MFLYRMESADSPPTPPPLHPLTPSTDIEPLDLKSYQLHEKYPSSNNDTAVSLQWNVLGTKVPQKEVVYFCQMAVLFLIILFSLINLTVGPFGKNGLQDQTWLMLLCSAIGICLPSPKLQKYKQFYSSSSDPRQT